MPPRNVLIMHCSGAEQLSQILTLSIVSACGTVMWCTYRHSECSFSRFLFYGPQYHLQILLPPLMGKKSGNNCKFFKAYYKWVCSTQIGTTADVGKDCNYKNFKQVLLLYSGFSSSLYSRNPLNSAI